MKKTLAYSYIRWSSGIQKLGRSLERQTTDPVVLNFIRDNNLDIKESMVHSGSSFNGKNFSSGTVLGKFLEQIKRGEIEKNSVLVIESLDRFGRDVITEMIPRFIEIIKSGVSIGLVDMNIIINLKMMNENFAIWQLVSNEMQRARRESERKSGFIKFSNLSKVASAKKGDKVYFGAQSPMWIDGVANGKFVLNVERVATIKRIFSMYLAGKSVVSIANTFNTTNVPTIGASKKKRTTVKRIWRNTSVKAILTSKSVVGFCNLKEHGFEQDNYYPSIVSENDFYKAQSKIAFNASTRGGSPSGNIPNIFRGITKCSKCGGGLVIQAQTKAGKKYPYARCDKSLYGECTNKGAIRMDEMEQLIFAFVIAQSPEELLLKPKQKNNVLEQLKTKLLKVNNDVNQTIELLGSVDMPQIKTKLMAFQMEQEQLKADIQIEENKDVLIKTSPATFIKLKELLELNPTNGKHWDAMEQAYTALEASLVNQKTREQLRNLVPDIFTRIACDMNQKAFVCHFTNGKQYSMEIENPTNDGLKVS